MTLCQWSEPDFRNYRFDVSCVLHFPRFPGMGRRLMIESTSLKGEGKKPNYILLAYLELMNLSMVLVHEMKDADSRIMSQSHPT